MLSAFTVLYFKIYFLTASTPIVTVKSFKLSHSTAMLKPVYLDPEDALRRTPATMFRKILKQKETLFWSILTLIIGSIAITLASQNTLLDSLSITFTVFAALALFFTAAMWLEEMIHEICNP